MSSISASEMAVLGLIQAFVGLDCLQIHLEMGSNYWAVTGLEPIASPFHTLLTTFDEGHSPEQHLIRSVLNLGREKLESVSMNRWAGGGRLAGTWCLLDSTAMPPLKPRAAAHGACWTLFIQFVAKAPSISAGLLAERTVVCPATVCLNGLALNDYGNRPARRGEAAPSAMLTDLLNTKSRLRRWYSRGPICAIIVGIVDGVRDLISMPQPRYCRGYPMILGTSVAEFYLKGRAGLDEDRGRLGLRQSGDALLERGHRPRWGRPAILDGWSTLARFYIDSPFGLERGFDAKGATAFGKVLAGHGLIVLTRRSGPGRVWPVQMGVALEPVLLDCMEPGLEIFYCAHYLPQQNLRLDDGMLRKHWLQAVEICQMESLRHVSNLNGLKAAAVRSGRSYRMLFFVLSLWIVAQYQIGIVQAIVGGQLAEIALRRLILFESVRRSLKEKRFV